MARRPHDSRGGILAPLAALTARLAPTLCVAALGLPAAAQVTPPPGSTTPLFVPEESVGGTLRRYVPLSEFEFAVQSTGALTVEPEILQWIDAAGELSTLALAVELLDGGPVTFEPVSATPASGVVTFTAPVQGRAVVVCRMAGQNGEPSPFENELPIVTHWDKTLNPSPSGPRGGQAVGATAGVTKLGVDLKGELEIIGGYLNPSDPSQTSHVVPPGEPSAGEPYFFATDRYALFHDGAHFADSLIPAGERYVAENWSLAKPRNIAAVWLSDRVRAATGFPIAHRSYDDDQDDTALFAQKLADDVPVFQLLHAYIVDCEDPFYLGREQSLATFVLPPGWMAAASHPVLFTGFYDLHNTTFGEVGIDQMTALGGLAAQDKVAVGILWNGGGASACQTMHPSARANALELLDRAEELVAADPDRLVLAGGSRGGTTALTVASNLPISPGTDVTVLAANPQVAFGDTIGELTTPTYPLVQAGIAQAAGYHNAWREDLVFPADDPQYGTGPLLGRELAGQNFTALEALPGFFNTIDATAAPIAAEWIQRLVDNGVEVVFQAATNDYSRPFSQSAEYVQALRAAGVAVRFEIHYRFGHYVATGLPRQPDAGSLLDRFFAPPSPYVHADEDVHVRRSPGGSPNIGEVFTPAHQPVVLECPILSSPDVTQTWTVSGPPETLYQVWLESDADNTFHKIIDEKLPAGSDITSVRSAPVLPPIAGSLWRLHMIYILDGSTTPYVVSVPHHAPPNQADALLLVTDPATPIRGAADDTRTGGLSSDADAFQGP